MVREKVKHVQKMGKVWLAFTEHYIYCFGTKKEVNKFVAKLNKES